MLSVYTCMWEDNCFKELIWRLAYFSTRQRVVISIILTGEGNKVKTI